MIRSQVRKTATAGVTVTSCDETLYDAPDGQPALAKAEFGLTYTGDLIGESSTSLLLVYTGGDPAQPATLAGEYLGLERVTCTLDGRTGSFVVAHQGRQGAAWPVPRAVSSPTRRLANWPALPATSRRKPAT